MTFSFRSIVPTSILLLVTLGLSTGHADDTDKIRRQLERLNQAIADARTLPNDSAAALEELRKDLFQTALSTRDAKKRSDNVEKALDDGQNPTLELSLLRTDITAAGNLLRELRDRIDEFDRIVKNNQTLIEEQNRDLQNLERALSMRPEAITAAVDAKTRKLQKEVDDLTEQLAARDVQIAKLAQKQSTREMSSSETVQNSGVTAAGLAKGFDLLAAGKIAEAQTQFEKVMKADPASLDAKVGLAACLFQFNDFPSAWSIVDAVLEEDGKNPRALGLKGVLLYRDGELKDARKSLERAIKYDETNPYYYNYLGVVQHALDDNEDAIESLKKAIELDSDYAAAMYNLAVVLASDERNPDLDLARYYYQRAITLGHPREPLLDQSLGVP